VRAPGRGYQRDNFRGSLRRNGSPPIPAETGRKYSNYSLARLWLILAGTMASAINNLSSSEASGGTQRGCGAASALTTGGNVGGVLCIIDASSRIGAFITHRSG
jgi:hypothetical protein